MWIRKYKLSLMHTNERNPVRLTVRAGRWEDIERSGENSTEHKSTSGTRELGT